MAETTIVQARIDAGLKEDATAVLADMGLTVSDVIRMVLTRIAVDGALPFELFVPNAETRGAMQEARAMMRASKGVFSIEQRLLDVLDEAECK